MEVVGVPRTSTHWMGRATPRRLVTPGRVFKSTFLWKHVHVKPKFLPRLRPGVGSGLFDLRSWDVCLRSPEHGRTHHLQVLRYRRGKAWQVIFPSKLCCGFLARSFPVFCVFFRSRRFFTHSGPEWQASVPGLSCDTDGRRRLSHLGFLATVRRSTVSARQWTPGAMAGLLQSSWTFGHPNARRDPNRQESGIANLQV